MYIKPELMTEEFDLEDVLTASSGSGSDTPGGGETEPSTGDTPGGDTTDPVGPEPSTDTTEPSTEPETISDEDFQSELVL